MNPVTSNDIKPADKLKLASAPQPDLTLAGIPGGVFDSIQNEYNVLNEQVKQGEGQTNNDAQDILNIMQDLTGKAQDTATANETAGVNKATEDQNKFVTQLSDLNAQASSLNREAQAIPIQVQQDFRNTGATDRGVAPITTGKLRENALRALSIAQQSDIAAAALTGSQIRLQAAKDKAQQMIDIKYKPLEDALAIKKQQYEFNKDILERYDKKRTEALNLTIKKEEREIADAKEKEKQLKDTAFLIATNQAPQDLVNKAMSAKSLNELMVIPGISKYLQSPTERLQQQKLGLDIAKTSEELKQLQNLSASEGLTPDQREKLLKDKTALQASARIGVINAIKLYNKRLNDLATRGVLGRKERAELNGMLNTTVGSAINVAQGQGALGNEEAERVMGGLKAGNFNSLRTITATANGAINAQNSLLENDFSTIDSGIPGATDSFEVFKNYKEQTLTDDEFFSGKQTTVDTPTYFGN